MIILLFDLQNSYLSLNVFTMNKIEHIGIAVKNLKESKSKETPKESKEDKE